MNAHNTQYTIAQTSHLHPDTLNVHPSDTTPTSTTRYLTNNPTLVHAYTHKSLSRLGSNTIIGAHPSPIDPSEAILTQTDRVHLARSHCDHHHALLSYHNTTPNDTRNTTLNDRLFHTATTTNTTHLKGGGPVGLPGESHSLPSGSGSVRPGRHGQSNNNYIQLLRIT